MTPALVALTIYQGQTFADSVQLTDDDGVPLDLSAKQARMQIRSYRGGPIVLELSTANGMIGLDALGNITFHVTAEQTAALGSSQYLVYEQWIYDLELFEDDAGEEVVDRALFGPVIFYTEVTRL